MRNFSDSCFSLYGQNHLGIFPYKGRIVDGKIHIFEYLNVKPCISHIMFQD